MANYKTSDPCRNGESINEWVDRHPVLIPYVDRGMVILLQRVGVVVVPLDPTSRSSWDCQVVAGNETYPPGGYRLSVGNEELRRGRQIEPERLFALAGVTWSASTSSEALRCINGVWINTSQIAAINPQALHLNRARGLPSSVVSGVRFHLKSGEVVDAPLRPGQNVDEVVELLFSASPARRPNLRDDLDPSAAH